MMWFGGWIGFVLLGLMVALAIGILIIVSIFYWRAKHIDHPRPHSDSSVSSIHELAPSNPTIPSTEENVFRLTMDNDLCGICTNGSLKVAKSSDSNALILTVTAAVGAFVTDIYAQVAYSAEEASKMTDLSIGYTHFPFDCTSNVATVSLPLSKTITNDTDIFLSVVANVADTCGIPLLVDQLTISPNQSPNPTPSSQNPSFHCTQPRPRTVLLHTLFPQSKTYLQ